MQKAIVAIVFALALSTAVAQVNTTAWAKAPIDICDASNTNCTNRTNLQLGGLTTKDVNIFSYNDAVIPDAKVPTTATWSVWTKVVDTKALTSTSNTTYGYTAASMARIAYGIAYYVNNFNDSNGVPQLQLLQTKLSAGAGTVQPAILISSNTDKNYIPQAVGAAYNPKYAFFFYTLVNGTKVNYTSLAAGATAVGKEYTLTTTFNVSAAFMIGAAWGEALGAQVVYAGWVEGDNYKVTTVDFSSGAATPANLAGYTKNTTGCAPYATDKKYYGIWCKDSTTNSNVTDVWVSANATTLLKLFTVANNTVQKIEGVQSYGPYLAFFYNDPSTKQKLTLSLDIWDVEKFVVIRPKADYYAYNTSTQAIGNRFRVYQAGTYLMTWNLPTNVSDVNATAGWKSAVQCGLLLEGSYLTTVFGSLLALIAGLFLF